LPRWGNYNQQYFFLKMLNRSAAKITGRIIRFLAPEVSNAFKKTPLYVIAPAGQNVISPKLFFQRILFTFISYTFTMKQYFITGTSSGVGKALAEQLIPDHKVTGISRNVFFSHRNYTHIKMDLSETNSVLAFQFSLDENADEYILINNAGMLGELKRTGDTNPEIMLKTIHVNFAAPAILCNTFLKQVKTSGKKALIINISSGAATHPIASWATYCATKVAVDMFTSVIAEELKETGNSLTRAYSVYPGIVDTAMQQHIRSADPSDFSAAERFRNYKNEGSLLTAGFVAERIIGKFSSSELPAETIMDVRKF